jgi:XTP/dITP diphosphohydrolase
MKEIILATSNPGKIVELQAILSPLIGIPQSQLDIIGPEETGLSFIENAILKARHASLLSQKPALADDSGLVVEALAGEPGIYSARFAGNGATDQDNINLLLSKLAQTPNTRRTAFFYCAIALIEHYKDPVPKIACGRWSGRIIDKPQGNQGFGYDSVFFVESHQCTVAELPAIIKNTISHRALALQALRRQL